jgi:peptide/nickel transport system substrate-binding protein
MRRLFAILFIAMLSVSLILGGCATTQSTAPSSAPQSTVSSVPSTGSQPTTSAASPSPSASGPKYGGTLRMISNPIGINLGWPADMSVSQMNSQFCLETLLHTDNKGNLIPWLAESYKFADDYKSITFNLRKGVKFHDGSDFNAEAVKWNLENFIKAKMAPNWSSVDITDDYTVRVNFPDWSNLIPTSFADASFPAFMISKAAFDKNGKDWMKQHPIGTGPFKFVSHVVDVSFKAVKNPDYWKKDDNGNPLPYLDAVENIFIADTMTQAMSMKNGEADMLGAMVPSKATADMVAQGFEIDYAMDMPCCLIPDTLNTDSPWSNQKVREAVEYAIDRENIAQALGFGFCKAPYQVPPRASLVYDPDFSLGRKYDLEKAKQLMIDAGYPEGFDTTIVVYPSAGDDVPLTLQADLAKIGIKITLEHPAQAKFISYIGPNATWHNAVIYMAIPCIDNTYSLGLQFLINTLGKSWQRTPEILQAYQDSLASKSIDINSIRSVTNMITQNASIIPINESGAGRLRGSYLHAGYNERGTLMLYNTESIWLDK